MDDCRYHHFRKLPFIGCSCGPPPCMRRGWEWGVVQRVAPRDWHLGFFHDPHYPGNYSCSIVVCIYIYIHNFPDVVNLVKLEYDDICSILGWLSVHESRHEGPYQIGDFLMKSRNRNRWSKDENLTEIIKNDFWRSIPLFQKWNT